MPDHYVLNHVKTVDGISDSSIIKADAEKLATKYVEELAKKVIEETGMTTIIMILMLLKQQ